MENLCGKTVTITNTQCVKIDNDWHLLSLPFNGQKIEIDEIYINDCPLQHLKYTGYFENSAGKKFQPATAVWEPGSFKIWIHPNVGFMKGEIFSQIGNGDYGKNLFEDYLFTVDRPIELSDDFPADLQGFFGAGAGPKWWHKRRTALPYVELDLEDSKSLFKDIELLEDQCVFDMPYIPESKLWTWKSWDGQSLSKADAKEFDEKSFNGFGKYFQSMGYKKLYQVYFAYLGPRGYIPIHVDDHVHSKNYKHIKGNTKFYCSYENHDEVLFKMAGVGCLPIDKPLMIDAGSFPHAVVNLSHTKTRKVLNLTGILQ